MGTCLKVRFLVLQWTEPLLLFSFHVRDMCLLFVPGTETVCVYSPCLDQVVHRQCCPVSGVWSLMEWPFIEMMTDGGIPFRTASQPPLSVSSLPAHSHLHGYFNTVCTSSCVLFSLYYYSAESQPRPFLVIYSRLFQGVCSNSNADREMVFPAADLSSVSPVGYPVLSLSRLSWKLFPTTVSYCSSCHPSDKLICCCLHIPGEQQHLVLKLLCGRHDTFLPADRDRACTAVEPSGRNRQSRKMWQLTYLISLFRLRIGHTHAAPWYTGCFYGLLQNTGLGSALFEVKDFHSCVKVLRRLGSRVTSSLEAPFWG